MCNTECSSSLPSTRQLFLKINLDHCLVRCGRASQALNGLQALWEFIPILHHNPNTQTLEGLGHLLLLFATAVAPNVTNDRNAGTHGTQCSTLAVLDGNTLSRLFADNLTGMEVDRGVRLSGWFGQRSGSAEDVVFGEILGLVDFIDASLDTTECTGADDREAVLLLLVQLVELLGAAHTGFGILLQFGNHSVLLHGHVFFHLRARDGEVKLFLQVHDHAAEVLADEVIEELGAGVAVWDVVFGEDLVGEVGAGFKGELF